MRRLVPLAGLLVALAIPAVASADSADGGGLCSEGYDGYNRTTRQFLADYESPQKGTPKNQGVWVNGARGGGTIYAVTASHGNVSTGPNAWNTYCTATMHWDKSTGFGGGEDYFIVSYVVSNTLAYPGVYHPTAYGSYKGHSYWRADANGATGDFNIAMPWGGYSNYQYATP